MFYDKSYNTGCYLDVVCISWVCLFHVVGFLTWVDEFLTWVHAVFMYLGIHRGWQRMNMLIEKWNHGENNVV